MVNLANWANQFKFKKNKNNKDRWVGLLESPIVKYIFDAVIFLIFTWD